MKTLTPVALIIAAIGLFYLYTNPQYQEIKTLRVKADAYDNAIIEAQSVVAKRNELVAKKQSFDQNDISKLSTMIPDSIDNIRLIIDVNDVARKHNAALKDIHVAGDSSIVSKEKSNDTKAYGIVTISFSTSATYEDFQKLLADYEKSLRLLDVAQVSVKQPEKGGSQYGFGVSLKTYWLK